jgi:hypothetical protein
MENLNHSFKIIKEKSREGWLACEICKILVLYSPEKHIKYWVLTQNSISYGSPSRTRDGVSELKITCEENQIKNLLE